VKVLSAETRIRIAVIDTGVHVNARSAPYLCEDGHADFTGYGPEDNAGHGTNVMGIIAQKMNPKTHCLMSIKFFNTEKQSSLVGELESLHLALAYILQWKPAYVNMSISGKYYDHKEYKVFVELLKSGTTITVAAGNNKLDLSASCIIYPACHKIKHKRFFVVGSSNGSFSNFGGPVNASQRGLNRSGWGVMLTGTSQSSAVQMSELIKGRSPIY